MTLYKESKGKKIGSKSHINQATSYTIKQLADAAKITVRTLHYYDEQGLLKPKSVKNNGYRTYGEEEMLRLQQILFFRELEFPLEQIKEIMNSPQFDLIEALNYHKKLILLKQKRLQGLVSTINLTINNMTQQKPINDKDMYGSFDSEELKAYQQEAKERWGHTDAWKQSQERVKNWTKADYAQAKKAGEELNKRLAGAMDFPLESKEVKALVAEHRASISVFYDVSDEMHKNLADMYVADPRFTATYDNVRPGLAQFLQKAIHYHTDNKG